MTGLEILAQRVGDRSRIRDRERLRLVRRDAGISAAQVAEAIGVSEAAVLSWERGDRDPTGKHLDLWMAAIHVIESA